MEPKEETMNPTQSFNLANGITLKVDHMLEFNYPKIIQVVLIAIGAYTFSKLVLYTFAALVKTKA